MNYVKFFALMILAALLQTGFAQTKSAACVGYPADEACCTKNRGTMVSDDTSSFCYLNLLTSRVTKADCMEAGGYAYWRNDSTMLCIPKGILVMTGNVTTIDETTKLISIESDGQTYSIIGTYMMLPQAGQTIDLFYTVDAEGNMIGKTCHPAMGMLDN